MKNISLSHSNQLTIANPVPSAKKIKKLEKHTSGCCCNVGQPTWKLWNLRENHIYLNVKRVKKK